MQQLDIARHWLNRAVAAGKKDAIKKMALADDDLQPLWEEIKEFVKNFTKPFYPWPICASSAAAR